MSYLNRELAQIGIFNCSYIEQTKHFVTMSCLNREILYFKLLFNCSFLEQKKHFVTMSCLNREIGQVDINYVTVAVQSRKSIINVVST
jgi:hypothetical protein